MAISSQSSVYSAQALALKPLSRFSNMGFSHQLILGFLTNSSHQPSGQHKLATMSGSAIIEEPSTQEVIILSELLRTTKNSLTTVTLS